MDAVSSFQLNNTTGRTVEQPVIKPDFTNQAEIQSESSQDAYVPASVSSEGSITKACGTIGSAIGAVSGRITFLPSIAAIKGAVIGGALFGPAGAIVGGVIGAGAGIYGEKKLRAGRVLGGMLGGAIGMGVGKVLDKMGIKPSKELADETKSFSFPSLFKKLQDPEFTSHKKITAKEAKEIVKSLKPGDLIIGNNDNGFTFEIVQKFIGASGNWTHVAIQAEDNTVMEVMIPELTDRGDSKEGHGFFETLNRPYMENETSEMIQRNHHLIILRPNYKDRETVKKVIDTGKSYKNVQYDMFFNLNSDDKHYCTEFAYKVLGKAAPEIKLKPSSFLGYKFMGADDFIKSPDVQVIYNTGSNFWHNYLSKFD